MATSSTSTAPPTSGTSYCQAPHGRSQSSSASPGQRETLLVGDRHATDIRMAKTAGMAGALVLTGATGADEALSSPDKPDYVIEDLNCCPRQGPGGA